MTARARRPGTAPKETEARTTTSPARARGSARRIEALAPAGLPSIAGRDWPDVRRALARTDDDEVPLLFGRLPG